MLSIEEKILTLNSLRLLPVAALRFTFYALRFLPVPAYLTFDQRLTSSLPSLPHNICETHELKQKPLSTTDSESVKGRYKMWGAGYEVRRTAKVNKTEVLGDV